jgi:hypothetical protein
MAVMAATAASVAEEEEELNAEDDDTGRDDAPGTAEEEGAGAAEEEPPPPRGVVAPEAEEDEDKDACCCSRGCTLLRPLLFAPPPLVASMCLCTSTRAFQLAATVSTTLSAKRFSLRVDPCLAGLSHTILPDLMSQNLSIPSAPALTSTSNRFTHTKTSTARSVKGVNDSQLFEEGACSVKPARAREDSSSASSQQEDEEEEEDREGEGECADGEGEDAGVTTSMANDTPLRWCCLLLVTTSEGKERMLLVARLEDRRPPLAADGLVTAGPNEVALVAAAALAVVAAAVASRSLRAAISRSAQRLCAWLVDDAGGTNLTNKFCESKCHRQMPS